MYHGLGQVCMRCCVPVPTSHVLIDITMCPAVLAFVSFQYAQDGALLNAFDDLRFRRFLCSGFV